MNYEKKYKEALERAKEKYTKCYSPTLLDYIFPELKESEDEKIRIAPINYFEDNGVSKVGQIPIDNVNARLEKQGSEPNWYHHKVDLSDCSEEYRKAYYDGWNNCNMQHSQYKSESNDVVKCLINGMKFYYEDNEEATWGTEKFSMKVKDILSWLEKQDEQNPYSGVSFKYNDHTWGMCARDGGVEILVDGEIKERVFLDNKPQGKTAFEAIREENTDNQNCGIPVDNVKPKIENEIEIPFGAKDSELQEATYYIPKGFHSEIDNDKVVIKKGEKPTILNEDSERIRKHLISLVNEVYNNTNYITFLEHKELLAWLEKLDDNIEL